MITLNWKTVESREKPATLDKTISSKNVYIRKNIKELKRKTTPGNLIQNMYTTKQY